MNRNTIKSKVAQITNRTASRIIPTAFLMMTFMTGTAAAETTKLGSIYCGTSIETLIGTFFGGMMGLALPLSLIYMVFSGFKYTRAGGNPEKEREAKKKLYYAGMGLAIIVGVLVIPEVANKIFSTVGMGFSSCVTPF